MKVVATRIAIGAISVVALATNQIWTHYKVKAIEKKVVTLEYMNGTTIDASIEDDIIKPILSECGMFSSFLWTQYNPKTKYLHFKKVIFRDDVGMSDVRLTTDQFNKRLISDETFEYYNNFNSSYVDFIDENSPAWSDPLLQYYKEESWNITNTRLADTLNEKAKQRIMDQNNGAIQFKLGALYSTTIKRDDIGLIYIFFLSLPNERVACYNKLGKSNARRRTEQEMLRAKKQIEDKIFNQIIV